MQLNEGSENTVPLPWRSLGLAQMTSLALRTHWALASGQERRVTLGQAPAPYSAATRVWASPSVLGRRPGREGRRGSSCDPKPTSRSDHHGPEPGGKGRS